MNLEQYKESYLQYCKGQKELDDKTIKAYKIDLQQFIAFLHEYDMILNKETINSYLMHLHEGYKQKTVKRKIASVKAFFSYLEEEEIVESSPFHKIKTRFKEEMILPKIIPRNMIEELLEYLYQAVKDDEKSEQQKKYILRDIAIIELLFATGLRISELCGLQDKAFDVKNGILWIKGKGKKERYLQVGNEEVLKTLKEYREKFCKDILEHGYFFVNRYGHPMSEQSARRMLHKYVALMWKDVRITPHMFRHSFATYLMEEDVNIRYIQKLLGHSSITTTQIYTFVAMEKEREILRTKHPRNKMLMGN